MRTRLIIVVLATVGAVGLIAFLRRAPSTSGLAVISPPQPVRRETKSVSGPAAEPVVAAAVAKSPADELAEKLAGFRKRLDAHLGPQSEPSQTMLTGDKISFDQEMLKEWGALDPMGAIAAIRSFGLDPVLQERAENHIVAGWATVDPVAAWDFVPKAEDAARAVGLVTKGTNTRLNTIAGVMTERGQLSTALELLGNLPDPEMQDKVRVAILPQVVKSEIAGAAALIRGLSTDVGRVNAAIQVSRTVATEDPGMALDFASNVDFGLSGPLRPMVVSQVFGDIVNKGNAQAALSWFENLPSAQARDAALIAFYRENQPSGILTDERRAELTERLRETAAK